MLHNEVVSQVQTLLTLLESVLAARGVLPSAAGSSAPAGEPAAMAAANSNDPKALERVFLFCLAWGIGGLLDKKDRTALDTELRKLTDLLPKQVSPAHKHGPAPPQRSGRCVKHWPGWVAVNSCDCGIPRVLHCRSVTPNVYVGVGQIWWASSEMPPACLCPWLCFSVFVSPSREGLLYWCEHCQRPAGHLHIPGVPKPSNKLHRVIDRQKMHMPIQFRGSLVG